MTIEAAYDYTGRGVAVVCSNGDDAIESLSGHLFRVEIITPDGVRMEGIASVEWGLRHSKREDSKVAFVVSQLDASVVPLDSTFNVIAAVKGSDD